LGVSVSHPKRRSVLADGDDSFITRFDLVLVAVVDAEFISG
jgi:hypothetical protein